MQHRSGVQLPPGGGRGAGRAYLIRTFLGRILDWHKKRTGEIGYAPDANPRVPAVRQMYVYFRKYSYGTICMLASWWPSRGADIEGSDVDEILASSHHNNEQPQRAHSFFITSYCK